MSDRSHSRDILPAIAELLARSGTDLDDLDAIAFGQGPGSFTGLRIAVGVVQGLAFGLGIPVVPVSTLACLAQAEFSRSGEGQIAVALHARKQEVFLGLYRAEDSAISAVSPETVIDVEDIEQTLSGEWVGVGDGWILREQLESAFGVRMKRIASEVYPDPHALLDLGIRHFEAGQTVSAVEARPEYLREQVARPSRPDVGKESTDGREP